MEWNPNKVPFDAALQSVTAGDRWGGGVDLTFTKDHSLWNLLVMQKVLPHPKFESSIFELQPK